MKKSLLLVLGFAINFFGFCLTAGQVVRGDIFNPSPQQNEMALLASAFLLGIAMSFVMYRDFKLIKKTDS